MDGLGRDMPMFDPVARYEDMKAEEQRLQDSLWRPTPPQIATVENPFPLPPPQAPTPQDVHSVTWTEIKPQDYS
jgi:hypothetical protein